MRAIDWLPLAFVAVWLLGFTIGFRLGYSRGRWDREDTER